MKENAFPRSGRPPSSARGIPCPLAPASARGIPCPAPVSFRGAALALALAAAGSGPDLLAGDEWRQWRGPSGNGIAAEGQKPPERWSESENVAWKAAVPGRGHSTPIVTGGLVVLTTADEEAQAQRVMAWDRDTGEPRWERELHRGEFPEKIHRKNTHATPSPCSDGERIFVAFHRGGRVHLSALDLEGELLWTRDTGPYRCQYGFGYAPSPVLAGDLVVVSSEHEEHGYLAAFDRASGEERWRVPRDATTSYSTPAFATVAGREQLFLSGNARITSYDPATGRELWQTEAVTKATCGTLVWEGDLIFGSGGFPNKETAAVRGDGSGEVAWKNGEQCYEQSLLVHQGHVYAINDGGIAWCWSAADGEQRWVQRLGGPVSASPVLADGKIYYTSERGVSWVARADPGEFVLLAENRLGDESFASPVICGGRIYLRVAKHAGGQRQEWLYCLEEKG